MGFAVGICLALDLRVLGVAPGVRIAEMRRFVPIVWIGFWVNAISGVLLLIGYPTKALTNPVFYLKLLLIAVGLVLFGRIGRRVFDETAGDDRHRIAGLAPARDRLDGVLGGRDHCRAVPRLHLHAPDGAGLMLHDLQIWLVTIIVAHSPVADLMHTAWAWPIAESVHFLGLCMLIGCIGTFDLRLLGVAKRVPIAAMHRLIPFGILGFVINISSGLMFVLTEPDQYIYNPSFHIKLLFLAIAGLNAGMFYLSSYRQVFAVKASLNAPVRAKVIAAISLGAWITVIVCGRLITFYRPAPCSAKDGHGCCSARQVRVSGNTRVTSGWQTWPASERRSAPRRHSCDMRSSCWPSRRLPRALRCQRTIPTPPTIRINLSRSTA